MCLWCNFLGKRVNKQKVDLLRFYISDIRFVCEYVVFYVLLLWLLIDNLECIKEGFLIIIFIVFYVNVLIVLDLEL